MRGKLMQLTNGLDEGRESNELVLASSKYEAKNIGTFLRKNSRHFVNAYIGVKLITVSKVTLNMVTKIIQ